MEPVKGTRRTSKHLKVELQNQLDKLVELRNQFKELLNAWYPFEDVMELQTGTSSTSKPVERNELQNLLDELWSFRTI